MIARTNLRARSAWLLCFAILPALAIDTGASAADSPSAADAADRASDTHGSYIHAGGGSLLFSEGAVLKAGGTVIAGGTISIAHNETLITEAGYRWGHWGISATGGFPPLATVKGAGSLAPLGSLGRIRYGPVVVSAHYHIGGFGRFQPYIGGGPVFLLIFKNENDAVQNLDVRSSVGVAVQAGTEFNVSRRWGLFLDIKKAHLRTTATAVLEASAISARIRLDPLVLSGGLAYRF